MKYFYPLIISISSFFLWFTPTHTTDSTANVSYNKIAKPIPKKVISKTPKKVLKSDNALSIASPEQWHAPMAATVTAVKSVAVQGGGNATAGGQLNYTVILSNTAAVGVANNATAVTFTDILNTNLTLVGGTVKATPIGVDDAYDVIGNVGITVPLANGVLANDVSPDGTALTVAVTTNVTKGTLALAADGSFTYTPNTGTSGSDSFVYTVTSANGTTSTNNTVTLTVTAPLWFVNIAAGSNGDGSLASPFKDWSNFATSNALSGTVNPAANQTIFVYAGTYTGAATLKSGQKVLGAGAGVSLASFAVLTVPPYSNTLPSTGGAKPNLTSAGTTITLNTNNTLQGFDMGNSVKDIVGSSFTTLTASEMALNGTGATLDLTTGALTGTFTSISSTNAAAVALSLTGITGSLTNTGTTTITNPTGRGIQIQTNSTLTSSFGNTTITGSGGIGVYINSSNPITTFGSLDISPDAGVQALNSTANNGTFTCTSGTIATSGVIGAAFSGINSGSKQALTVALTSLSASGAANGFTIANTTGSFAINGNGTIGSGGTIATITNRGADISNASSITLKNMTFTNANTTAGTAPSPPTTDNSGSNAAIYFNTVNGVALDNIQMNTTVGNANAQHGISLLNVTTFTLANSTITRCGTDAEEAGIYAVNTAGTCSISNSTISKAARCVRFTNNNTNMTLKVTGSSFNDTRTFHDNTTLNGEGSAGILFEGYGTSNVSLDVKSSCNFLRVATGGVDVIASDNATVNVDVQNSTFNSTNASLPTGEDVGRGVSVDAGINGIAKFNILNNTITGRGGNLINIGESGTGRVEGTIEGNTVNYNFQTSINNNGGHGISYNHFGTNNTSKVKINNNIVTGIGDAGGFGINTLVQAGRGDIICTNNNVTVSGATSGAGNAGANYSIRISSTASGATACSRIANNTVTAGALGYAQMRASVAGAIHFQEGNTAGSIATPHTSIWNFNSNTPTIVTNASPTFVSVGGNGTNTLVAANTCAAPTNGLLNLRIATPELAQNSDNLQNGRVSATDSSKQKVTEIVAEELKEEEVIEEEIQSTKDLSTLAKQNSVAGTQSGETITVNGAGSGFTLPAGKSTTITFSATISNTPTSCLIENEATISGTGFSPSSFNSNKTATNLIVPIPTGQNSASQICNGQSIALVATCSSGTVQWYNAAATATLLGTSASLGTFTQSPTTSTTYQVACLVGGCESTRVNTGLITVNLLPVPGPGSNSPVCTGKSLDLTSASSNAYSWSGPNNFTSSLRNPSIPSVTALAQGTYTITQTTSLGCTASATVAVIINTTPTAGPGSNSPICAGNTLNLSSESATSYLWAGPNSFSSSTQNPTIPNATTGANGIYTLTVTSASGCTASATIGVTVNASPTANPGSNTPICTGSTLNLSSSVASTYLWAGPNSFTSSIQSPTILNATTDAGGTYTLTVSNASGCTASATTAVVVTQTPTPTIGSNSPVLIGANLNLTSSGGTTYLWAGPNSFSSTTQNPTISTVTLAAAGTYTVTVSNGACSATATTEVIISEATVSSNSPICSGTTLNLSSSGGKNYLWAGPNSFSSTEQNPQILNATSLASGTYTVTVTSGVNNYTLTTAVTVNDVPIPTAGSNTPVCAGNTLNLSSNGGANYLWAGPNSFSSTTQNPTINNATTAATGTYTVTVSNGNCSATATTAVTVNAVPIANAGTNAPICEGTTLTLSSEGGVTYLWNGPNSFSSTTQNPSIVAATPLASGTYTVTVTNASNCTATATVAVTVNALPTPTISSNSPICVGNTLNLSSSGGSSYAWTGPNNFSSTTQNPQIINSSTAASGIYTVTITNGFGCTITATTSVTVVQVSPPAITPPGQLVVCAPSTLTLTASGCAGTVTWSQGSTGTSLTLSVVGTYSITATCTVSSCTSAPSTAVTGLEIKAKPAAPTVTPPAQLVVCSPSTLTLTASGCAGTVAWSTGATGTSLILSTVGTYSITANCTVNGCTSDNTSPVNVEIKAKPAVPTITPPNPLIVCSPSTLTLTASGCAGTVTWSQGSATGSSLTLSTVGTYSVTATCTVNGCTSDTSPAVTGLEIKAKPATPTVTPPAQLVVCSPSTLTLTASGCAGLLTWSTGATGTSLILSTPGTYSITANCTVNGCSSDNTSPVNGLEIKAKPAVPTITPPNPLIVCSPSTLTLTASGCAGTVTWSQGSATGSSLTLSTVGTYSVTAICTINGCTSDTSPAVTGLEIKALPNAQASNTGPYTVGQTIALNATGGTTYAWTGPNSFTSAIPNPTIPNSLSANGGIYTVTVTTNGCPATATTNVVINGIDPCDPSRIVDYIYVKAGNPYQALFPLSNGMVINQITDQVSIIVNPVCQSVTIGSFEMNIQGPELNWNIIQNIAPYALFDNYGVNVYGRNFIPGTYTLTVTGYAQGSKGGAKTYGPVVTTFTVVGNLATISMPTLTGTAFCAGTNVDVTFSTTGTFNVGNQFQVQLSDANGSFAAPVIIGTRNTPGTVNATIPLNTPQGSNYLIRVASSNQVVIGNPTMNLLTVHPLVSTLVNPTDNLTGTNTKKAVNIINASNKITSPANVLYQAGKAIVLTPGFESGAVFKAEIQTCTN